MKPDILINGTSMLNLGWLRESIDFPVPQSQTETITVPGRNSPIRYSEALGRVSYQPRSFTATLTMLGSRSRFNTMVGEVVNRYAGQLVSVIRSEEPGLFAYGTLQMESQYDPIAGKGVLTLNCSDGDSYLYHVQETVVTKTGSGTIVLNNDFMPVIPVVTTTGETTLRWKVGSDTFDKTISSGTWEFPELELEHGENSISVACKTSSDTVTFRYREGRL